MDRFIQGIQDGRIDLLRAQQAITKAGGTIDDQVDARLHETLYQGRVAHRAEVFLDLEVKPLLDSIARNKVTTTELSDYLLARHAPEANAQIATVNPNLPDGGAGKNSEGVLMTTSAANDYIANLPRARRDLLKMIAEKVDAITAGTRRLLVAEGLESQETIDAWETTYRHYVPLFKEEEGDDLTPHPRGSGFSVRGSASKRRTGGTGEVTNVLAHVLMQREAAIARAEKNRVSMSLYALALSQPNKDFWTTIRPNMSTADLEQSLQDMGLDPAVAVGMDRTPTITTINKKTGLVQRTVDPRYKSMPNALVLRVDGQDRVILFNKANERAMRLALNLKNADGVDRLGLATTIVGKATRMMASLNTQYNPAFGIVNLIRDTGSGMANLSSTPLAGKQLQVMSDVPGAMRGILRRLRHGSADTEWSRLYEQFKADGGKTGYSDLVRDPFERTQKIEDELKKIADGGGRGMPARAAHAILDGLDGFNEIMENATRLAAYKAALDHGMSRPQAARLARELTVDFNRKGVLTRELSPLYAFLNASVQGTARTIQTLKGPAGKKIMAGGFALGVLQVFMLAAAGIDDDEIPDFEKARSFIIPTGDKKYFAVPLPLGLHVLPNTGRVLTELFMSGGKNYKKRLYDAVGEIAGAFNPFGGGNIFTLHGLGTTLAPTVADPLVDLATNTNFAGNKISKETFPGDRRPRHDLGKENTLRLATGQAYQGVAEVLNRIGGGNDYKPGVRPLNWTPEEVRYVVGAIGGGLWREVEKSINAVATVAAGDSVKPREMPLTSRFRGEIDAEQVTRSRYFEASGQIKDAAAELKGAEKKGDREAYQRVLKDHPAEAAMIESLRRIDRDLSELNGYAMDSIGDRAKLKRIDEARTKLMASLNEAFKRMEARVDEKKKREVAATP